MGTYKTYKDLDAWVSAKDLAKHVYALTESFPTREQFGLTNQLRRASVSVPSNIAEGYGRQYKKETVQFLFVAKGSLNEMETQLLIAMELNFMNDAQHKQTELMIETTRRLLIGYINYLQKKETLK